MKKLMINSIVLACLTFGLSISANAKPTPIKFERGSYCADVEIGSQTKSYSLYVNANQTITYEYDNSTFAFDVIVKDPKGRTLRPLGQDYGEWRTKMRGNHTIVVVDPEPGYFMICVT